MPAKQALSNFRFFSCGQQSGEPVIFLKMQIVKKTLCYEYQISVFFLVGSKAVIHKRACYLSVISLK
jgi:hypothetical protein